MELGFFGVDLAELEVWKTRARQILRCSRDPPRSLQRLRDKAASLFDFDGLRVPSKVNPMKEGCAPPRQPLKGDPLAFGREERVRPFDSDQ